MLAREQRRARPTLRPRRRRASVCASSHEPGGAITATRGPAASRTARARRSLRATRRRRGRARRRARAGRRGRRRARSPCARYRAAAGASKHTGRPSAAARAHDAASSSAAAAVGGTSSAHATRSSSSGRLAEVRASMPRARSAATRGRAERARARSTWTRDRGGGVAAAARLRHQRASRGARCTTRCSAIRSTVRCAAACRRAAAARDGRARSDRAPSVASSSRCIDADGIGVGYSSIGAPAMRTPITAVPRTRTVWSSRPVDAARVDRRRRRVRARRRA